MHRHKAGHAAALGVFVAPVGLGYFAYSELKVRRRERELALEAEAADPDAPVTVEAKLADRYGRRP